MHIITQEEHVYPENINVKEWIELEPEITEVLEHKPEEFFVRRIIHHKYIARNKSVLEVQGNFKRQAWQGG